MREPEIPSDRVVGAAVARWPAIGYTARMGWIATAWTWIASRIVYALGVAIAGLMLLLLWMQSRIRQKDMEIARATGYRDTTKRISGAPRIEGHDEAVEWLQERQDARRED